MVFGDRLKELREGKGITQKTLGRVINVSDRVIGYYESNDRFPKDENVLKMLADYFNVSVDYLVGHTPIDSHSLNIENLPPEAIKMAEDYIELLRFKYSSNHRKHK